MTFARRIGIALAAFALIATPMVLAGLAHPTPMDWRHLRFDGDGSTHRIDALAGREAEIRRRDAGWNQGRTRDSTPSRAEMEFLAEYERLRTQATPAEVEYRAHYEQLRATAHQASVTGTPVEVRVG